MSHVSRVTCNTLSLQPLLPRQRRDSLDRPTNRAAAAAAAAASISAAVAAAHAQQLAEPRTEGNVSSSSSSSRWLLLIAPQRSWHSLFSPLPPAAPCPHRARSFRRIPRTCDVDGCTMRDVCDKCVHSQAPARCSPKLVKSYLITVASPAHPRRVNLGIPP